MTFSDCSNVVDPGNNPAYTRADFLAEYPQFTDTVPEAVVTRTIARAHGVLAVDRYFTDWAYAMGLYVAHYCTLYLQTTASASASAEDAMATGQAVGTLTSMTQGDVKVVFDHGVQTQGTADWGQWNATVFGRQLATLARLYGLGGTYVI